MKFYKKMEINNKGVYFRLTQATFNPTKEAFYSHIVGFYKNPLMTKIRDEGNFSLYAVKIHSQLLNEHRYVLIYIYKTNSVEGEKIPLSQLKWTTLMTKSIPENFDCDVINHTPWRMPELMVKTELQNIEETKFIYSCKNYPLKVILWGKDDNPGNYRNSGTIAESLETYNTAIIWL